MNEEGSPKVTPMSARKIIDPYFFEDERGCYHVEMQQQFLSSKLQHFTGYNKEQDGPTSSMSLPRVCKLFPK